MLASYYPSPNTVSRTGVGQCPSSGRSGQRRCNRRGARRGRGQAAEDGVRSRGWQPSRAASGRPDARPMLLVQEGSPRRGEAERWDAAAIGEGLGTSTGRDYAESRQQRRGPCCSRSAAKGRGCQIGAWLTEQLRRAVVGARLCHVGSWSSPSRRRTTGCAARGSNTAP
jgi:hypothetical protein